MAKYDRNGVKHDGWAAVGDANQNKRGRAGSRDAEYEAKARSQGVNLSQTMYNRVRGYKSGNL